MRLLFGVDSYFQLIMATNLRITVYKDCEADLILYNSMRGAETVANRVKESGVFEKTYLATTPLTYCGSQYSKKQKLGKYFIYIQSMISPRRTLSSIIGDNLSEKYDFFLFNGHGALPECIFNTCLNINPNLKCYRFEDGFTSYSSEFSRIKGGLRYGFEKCFDVLFKRRNIEKYIVGYYFLNPSLVTYNLSYSVLQNPIITHESKELLEKLNDFFDYDRKYEEEYQTASVIFFEDGNLFFNGGDEEVNVVRILTECVLPEKIIIKMHPRRKENRYKEFGVKVASNSSIPWELIQLNCNLDGKIMITAGSNSVFSADALFNDPCYKIMFYRCVPGSDTIYSGSYRLVLEKYKNENVKSLLFFPNDYEELKSILIDMMK